MNIFISIFAVLNFAICTYGLCPSPDTTVTIDTATTTSLGTATITRAASTSILYRISKCLLYLLRVIRATDASFAPLFSSSDNFVAVEKDVAFAPNEFGILSFIDIQVKDDLYIQYANSTLLNVTYIPPYFLNNDSSIVQIERLRNFGCFCLIETTQCQLPFIVAFVEGFIRDAVLPIVPGALLNISLGDVVPAFERPISVETCEDDTLNINCPVGRVISIKRVFYGRINGITCQLECITLRGFPGCINNAAASCASIEAKQTLETLCNSRQTCTVVVNAANLGNPCDNSIYKYLKTQYQCLSGPTK